MDLNSLFTQIAQSDYHSVKDIWLEVFFNHLSSDTVNMKGVYHLQQLYVQSKSLNKWNPLVSTLMIVALRTMQLEIMRRKILLKCDNVSEEIQFIETSMPSDEFDCLPLEVHIYWAYDLELKELVDQWDRTVYLVKNEHCYCLPIYSPSIYPDLNPIMFDWKILSGKSLEYCTFSVYQLLKQHKPQILSNNTLILNSYYNGIN
jgi:hypothetical protein